MIVGEIQDDVCQVLARKLHLPILHKRSRIEIGEIAQLRVYPRGLGIIGERLVSGEEGCALGNADYCAVLADSRHGIAAA